MMATSDSTRVEADQLWEERRERLPEIREEWEGRTLTLVSGPPFWVFPCEVEILGVGLAPGGGSDVPDPGPRFSYKVSPVEEAARGEISAPQNVAASCFEAEVPAR